MGTQSVAVPWKLKVKRAWRRFPPNRARSVVNKVVTHPSNQQHRVAALSRAVRWQVRSRIRPTPIDVPVWGGLTLRCYPRSGSASNVIYFTEDFDPAEMLVIRAVVRPGDTTVDAGANIGAYSLLLAHLVGPRGQVIAIEPGALAADRLEENVRLNDLGQVRVERAAVGAAERVAEMTADMDVSNTLTIGPGTHDVVEVRVVPLDALVERAPSFVKLDVEGFEREALLGAARVLSERPVLQIEVTEHLLRRAGTSGAELRSLLEDRGFRTGFPHLTARGVELREAAPPGGANLIAAPVERWDDLSSRLTAARAAPPGR